MKKINESTEVAVMTIQPSELLKLAINKDADIEKLKGLMDLQERWEAKEAKKAYLLALSDFQSRCPDIKKTQLVDYTTKTGHRVRYTFASLDGIVKQIRTPLKKCGLSYSWSTNQDKTTGEITVVCSINHIDGHQEQHPMTSGKDATGSKNNIQQIGSTVSYLRRYTLCDGLGISTAEADIDGAKKSESSKAKPQIQITEANSKELFDKAKIIIDEYTDHKELKSKSISFVKDEFQSGMHQKDIDVLKKYINAKIVSLKKAGQTKSVDLP